MLTSGEKYNISAASNGWNTTASVEVYSESAMSGGTNKIVTVVQQSDIEAAKAKLTAAIEGTDPEAIRSATEEMKAAKAAMDAADEGAALLGGFLLNLTPCVLPMMRRFWTAPSLRRSRWWMRSCAGCMCALAKNRSLPKKSAGSTPLPAGC